MSGAKIWGANFRGTILTGANLTSANLSGAILEEAILTGANLTDAKLIRVNFKKAHLTDSQFQNANLSNADFSEARVTFAIFHHANLRNANMEKVIDLTTPALGGADVSSAKLPENVEKFDGITAAQNTIQMARPVFIALMLGCLYSWLTMSSISYKAIILGEEMFPLPVLQTNIKVQYFFVAGPLIILGLFIYLHHYLKTLWEHFSQLPAIFTDGRTIEKTVYPWMLTSVVYRAIPILKNPGNQPNMWKVPAALSFLTAWLIAPFTVYGYWIFYFSKHDIRFNIGLLVILIFILLCSLFYYKQAYSILRIERNLNVKFFYFLQPLLVLLMLGFFIQYINPPFANLSNEELSKRSEKLMWNASLEEMLATVKGANLKNADLSGANLFRSFLFHADMSNANLQGADLRKANIRCADLRGANLFDARITKEQALSAILDDKTKLYLAITKEERTQSGPGCPRD